MAATEKFEVRIFQESDRLDVAAILVKNGYRVVQGKKPRIGANELPTKSVDYILIAEDMRGADDK